MYVNVDGPSPIHVTFGSLGGIVYISNVMKLNNFNVNVCLFVF
jgi:hypothetical protein